MLFLLTSTPQVGLSTVYGYPGDPYNSTGYACESILRQKGIWRISFSRGIAHRTLPCGTHVLVCANHLCTPAIVVDRGPYGAINPQGKWRVASRLRHGERYRGIADLLPTVAKKIKHNGKQEISLWIAPH